MEQLNGLDSLLILSEFDHAPLHIGAIMVYELPSKNDKALSYANIEQLLLDVIDNTLPILKSKVAINRFSFDHPYWVTDEHFDLHNHIKQVQLDKSSGWPELHALSSAFHAAPLASDKPLWEVMLVEGLDGLAGPGSGGSAVLLKIHHALADGKTAVKLFSALHALSPERDAPLMARGLGEHAPNFTAPHWLNKYYRAYKHTVISPMKMAHQISHLSRILMKTQGSDSVKAISAPPRTPFSAMPEADRVIGHIAIPFTELTPLTESTPYSINDVAVTVIAGAMREYLSDVKGLSDAELQTLIPIDIRSGDDDNSIGNQISFAKMKLFSEVGNPQDRLQAVHEATTRVKKEHVRMGPRTLLDFANATYPTLLTHAATLAVKGGLIEKLPPMTNTVISNVPGIPVPCYLCGAKLIDYVGLGFLVPSVTLFHTISSVYSHVNISFLSCANSLNDTARYQQALQDSWLALHKSMT